MPARVDRATGSRRYAKDQIVTAVCIALLRRAGISLADIQWFLAAPAAAVIDRWPEDLAAETGVGRRALEALASALGFGTPLPEDPAMAVVIRPVDSATALVTVFDVAGAQFDPAIEHTDQRRFADLEAGYSGERALGYAVELGRLGSNPVDRIQWTAPAVAASVDRRVVVSPAQAGSLLNAVGRLGSGEST